MANRRFRHIKDANLLAMAHLIKALDNARFKGYTVDELVEISGFNPCTVQRYLCVLHQVGAAYIEGYEIDGRGCYSIRRWKLGQDDDAIPTVLPRAQRAAAQRHRERLNPKLRLNGVQRSNADEATYRRDDGRNVRAAA